MTSSLGWGIILAKQLVRTNAFLQLYSFEGLSLGENFKNLPSFGLLLKPLLWALLEVWKMIFEDLAFPNYFLLVKWMRL